LVYHTQTTGPHLNSSMFQQCLSQSSAWKGHVWIGCSPDGTCAPIAIGGGPGGAMKCRQDKVQMNPAIGLRLRNVKTLKLTEVGLVHRSVSANKKCRSFCL